MTLSPEGSFKACSAGSRFAYLPIRQCRYLSSVVTLIYREHTYSFLINIVGRIVTSNDDIVIIALGILEPDAGYVKPLLDECESQAGRRRHRELYYLQVSEDMVPYSHFHTRRYRGRWVSLC